MTLSVQRIFASIFVVAGFAGVFVPKIAILGAVFLVLGFILAFREHQKNKRQSNRQKHTAKRAGEVYDKEQNLKRGEKNKNTKKNQILIHVKNEKRAYSQGRLQ